jgi:hypothetical protein
MFVDLLDELSMFSFDVGGEPWNETKAEQQWLRYCGPFVYRILSVGAGA